MAGAAGRRVAVIAGDFNDTEWGGGYGVIWASLALYCARDLVALLAKARQHWHRAASSSASTRG